MQSQSTKNERFNNRLHRYASIERLMLMRNLGYGGAAASLVILLGLIQVGAKSLFLQVSILSISASLPLWLLIGGIYELYIFLGKESYSHLRKKSTYVFFGAITLAAGLSMFVSIGGIIWFLMPEAAYVFGAVALVCIISGGLFHDSLQSWWFGPDGPEPETYNKND